LKLNDKQFISGSEDNSIKLWNLPEVGVKKSKVEDDSDDDNDSKNTEAGPCTETLTGHTGSVLCLEKLNDFKFISGSEDKSIRFWNLKFSTCIALIRHKDAVLCLLKLNDLKFISGCRDREVRTWNAESGDSEMGIIEHTDAVACFAKLNDEHFVSGSWDHSIGLWKKGNYTW